MNATHTCPLCATAAPSIWRNAELRVIDAQVPDYPGYTRVIWNTHVVEMTQLDAHARQRLMQAVWIVEQTQRAVLAPTKVNLAQFGNQVPHLHWHVIARWSHDVHFPSAIWADATDDPQRQAAWASARQALQARVPNYHVALRDALDTMPVFPPATQGR